MELGLVQIDDFDRIGAGKVRLGQDSGPVDSNLSLPVFLARQYASMSGWWALRYAQRSL